MGKSLGKAKWSDWRSNLVQGAWEGLLLGAFYSILGGLIVLVRGGVPLQIIGISPLQMILLYLAGGVMTGAVAGFLRPIGRTLVGAMLVGVISAIPISIMLSYVLTMHTELERHLFGIASWMSLAGSLYGASVWIWDHKRS